MQTETYQEAFKKAGDEAKDDAKSIKNDIQNLLKRLNNLKEESKNILLEDSEQLISTILEMKEKMMDKGNKQLQEFASYIKNAPLKSAVLFFSIGLVFAMMCRGNKN